MKITLDQAVKLRDNLRESGGAYRSSPDRMMHVAEHTVNITQQELEEAKVRGQKIFEIEDMLNSIYVEKMKNDSNIQLVQLIESTLDDKTRYAQRLIAQERPLSLLKRTDESRPGFIVEVQKRLGGMCFFTQWHRAYYSAFPATDCETTINDTIDYIQPLTWMLSDCTINPKILVLITPKKDLPSQTYFANIINAETDIIAIPVERDTAKSVIDGNELHLTSELINQLEEHNYQFPYNISKVSRFQIAMIYRRELTLDDFVKFNNWDKLLDHYLNGTIIIQPELNLLEDMKLPLGLLSLPEVSEIIPKSLLSLFPKTGIMPADWETEFILGDETLTLSDVLKMTKKKRRFIIKYAGTNQEYGSFGGRGVFRLSSMSREKSEEEITKAITQIRGGHLWIIQELDQTYYDMAYLDKEENIFHESSEMHARLCFYYYRTNNGVELITGEANLREHWKAGGADDAVVAPIRVQKDSKVQYKNTKHQGHLRTLVSGNTLI